MDLLTAIRERARELAGELVPQPDGSLKLEQVVAERKSFLSRKKVTYVCRLRVDEPGRTVRFFETLKESGSGLSGGGGDDELGPGFGFRKETYVYSGKGRGGCVAERLRLLGDRFTFRFDHGRLHAALRREAEAAGFAFEARLTEKGL
jgi:hypothetical protein